MLRRHPQILLAAFAALVILVPLGFAMIHLHATPEPGEVQLVWGMQGVQDGMFQRPRAMAIDSNGEIYVVDKTARIQVFDRNGKFQRGWRTPEFANGKPTGLTFDSQGNLMVADTHYFRILFYSPQGEWLTNRTLGGTFGRNPGEFGLVTDAEQDSQGFLYVSEYGEYDRIQKFTADGQFVMEWGGHGSEPGQFARPQNLAIDELDQIWVADACNHRIQVFDASGDEVRLVQIWGSEGSEPGQLKYPYDLILEQDDDGSPIIYICEFGNHRVQKLTRDGKFIASWGSVGRGEGELFNPWSLIKDPQGDLHVLDTYNHRVQRVRL
ncbi:MAG: hypothetical protein KDA87_18200 [Planctomycetales bacterium]|nr:hypothetical protein [Planctomycetales bacterium]